MTKILKQEVARNIHQMMLLAAEFGGRSKVSIGGGGDFTNVIPYLDGWKVVAAENHSVVATEVYESTAAFVEAYDLVKTKKRSKEALAEQFEVDMEKMWNANVEPLSRFRFPTWVVNGKLSNFTEADTDNAWIGYQVGVLSTEKRMKSQKE